MAAPRGTFLYRVASLKYGAVVKDDALLIDEVLAGDTSAFGQLVIKYQDRLFNTLSYVVGSCEEAEDVVQDIFTDFVRNSGDFVLTGSLPNLTRTEATKLIKGAGAGGRQAVELPARRDRVVDVAVAVAGGGDEPVVTHALDRCGDLTQRLGPDVHATQLHHVVGPTGEGRHAG